MKLSEKQFIHAYNISLLILWAHCNGHRITKGDAWRPPEMQRYYIAKKRSKVLFSKHLSRLADDLNLWIYNPTLGKFIYQEQEQDKESYLILGEQWEHIDPHNRWGGRFGVLPENYDKEVGWDSGHFEYNG